MSGQSPQRIPIKLNTANLTAETLEGLAACQRLGLLQTNDLEVELSVDSQHPELLQGLDVLARYQLLTDEQIHHICCQYLVCQLPAIDAQPAALPAASDTQSLSLGAKVGNLASTIKTTTLDRMADIAQSLSDELSVFGLLLLGVFSAIIGSGLLAAQLLNVLPPTGQYGILWLYTLAFFRIQWWSQKQSNLRLTAKMLELATLLLLPVNFWAIDALMGWQTPLSWFTTAIAVGSFAVIAYKKPYTRSRQAISITLGISLLHWGWNLPEMPLFAAYISTIGTASIFFYQSRQPSPPSSSTVTSSFPFPAIVGVIWGVSVFSILVRAIFVENLPISQLGLAFGICGFLLCWLPSFPYRQPLQLFGMALLLLGWGVSVVVTPPWQALLVSVFSLRLLFDRLYRYGSRRDWLAIVTIGLQAYILAGRSIPPQIQQIGVSLSSQLAGENAPFYERFGMGGFPSIWLLLGLAWWLHRCQQQGVRWSPRRLIRYTEWLALGWGALVTVASFGNSTMRTVNLGACAITNLVYLWETPRRRYATAPTSSAATIYLSHGLIVAAIASAIYTGFAPVSRPTWSMVLMGGSLAEWLLVVVAGISRHRSPPTHRQQQPRMGFSSTPRPLYLRWLQLPYIARSAWHIGLVFAIGSYVLNFIYPYTQTDFIWLAVPVGLTLVSQSQKTARNPERMSRSGWLSVAALVAWQILLLSNPWIHLWGLAIAAVLSWFNTWQIQQKLPMNTAGQASIQWQCESAAAINIAFCLALTALGFWQYVQTTAQFEDWLVAAGVVLLVLWIVRYGLLVSTNHSEALPTATLSSTYIGVFDTWAALFSGILLTLLSFYCVLFFAGLVDDPNWNISIAAAIATLAAIFRVSQGIDRFTFFRLAWAVEVLAASLLIFLAPSTVPLAVTNIALGLLSQLGIDVWWRYAGHVRHSPSDEREGQQRQPSIYKISYPSWYIIPPLYAIGGWWLSQPWNIQATSPWFALGTALVLVGVGRHSVRWKWWSYLGMLGVSIAAYQGLLYAMAHEGEGAFGDGLAVLAGLGAAIAWAYPLLGHWMRPYLGFTQKEWRVLSQLHWLGSTVLLGLKFSRQATTIGEWMAIAVMVLLAGYAIFQGRTFPPGPEGTRAAPRMQGEIWTYLGIVQALVAIAYLLWLVLPEFLLITFSGVVATFLSTQMWNFNWRAWGWSKRPWRQIGAIAPLSSLGAVIPVDWPSNIALLVVAGFYAFLAQKTQRIRISYVGVALANITIFRILSGQGLEDLLWYLGVVSASLIYISQVDPALQSVTYQQSRHWLRCLASGIFGFRALYQFGGEFLTGLFVLAIGIAFILMGLVTRVRAYLYVGSLVFIIQIFRHIWMFASTYNIVLWALLTLLGLFFIWAAASFESSRGIASFIQNKLNEIEDWE